MVRFFPNLVAPPSLRNLPLLISQRRGLKLVETKEIEYIAPTKFNFVRYGYPFYQSWDNTSKRFSENSKIIVVEGNVCTGKGHVAQKLAEAFGMYYFSDCTDDDIYTFKLPQGDFDLRSHNHALPDFAKYYTTSMFWNDKDPIKNGKPLYLQIQYFARRYFSYTKAKCMLFNTGQGSVLERSPFSDFVFAQALNHCGLLSDYALDWFMYNHASTVRSIWRPHVVVYLRTPLSMIREEIKKRNVPWQTNAHNLTDKFITSYTSLLEKNYLEPISKISQVFVIDRSTTEIYDEEDMRIQMERLTDFELDGKGLLKDDIKFLEWRDNTHRETPSKRARWFFSDVLHCFTKQLEKLDMPLDMLEGYYSPSVKELRGEIRKRDPRLPRFDLFRYASHAPLWRRIFDPTVLKRNFELDMPKQFLFKF